MPRWISLLRHGSLPLRPTRVNGVGEADKESLPRGVALASLVLANLMLLPGSVAVTLTGIRVGRHDRFDGIHGASRFIGDRSPQHPRTLGGCGRGEGK